MIHIAWPIAGVTWLIFLGEQFYDEFNVLLGRRLRPRPTRGSDRGSVGMTGSVLSSGEAALILFGIFFGCLVLRVPVAFALALACLPI
jgi:hypothetical protein